MDLPKFTPPASVRSNVAIGSGAIDSIETHQKEFAQLCKQSAPGAKAHKPERVKIHLTPKEERYFGDGSTMGAIKAFFWNLVTLCIGYKQCGGDLFEEGDALDEHIRDGEARATHIANAGIDDANETNQLNWLHHLRSGEVEELISVVRELKRDQAKRPALDFTEGREVILYRLNTKPGVGTYQIMANPEGIWFRKTDSDDLYSFKIIFKIMSLQEYQNMQTLDAIKRGLTAQARIAFQPYLTLQDIGYVDKESPVVAGDMGGSTALMVLLGIQTGKIDINENGIAHLVTLLNAEAEIVGRIKNAKNEEEVKRILQSLFETVEPAKEKAQTETADELTPICKKHVPENNERTLPTSEVAKAKKLLDELEKCLKYKQSAMPLIFSSDIASDPIRQAMKKEGVIFIAGINDLDSVARDKKNQAKVCSNAHYEKSTNTLYVNRGIKIRHDTPWLVRTAMENVFRIPDDPPFIPGNFVEWMNKQVLPSGLGAFNFAPTPGAMQAAATQLGVRIVMAADEIMDGYDSVIALNPLGSPHAQPVLAARIGRATLTIS